MSNTIWLTDRSRIADGRGFCQMARFLGYHFGPSGYGIQMKGTKLPLMTGIAGHDGLAPILEWARDNDQAIVDQLTAGVEQPVSEEVVRAAIAGAQAAYWKTVEARGFAYMEDDANVQYVTREQNYLIEGLIWAWVLEVLPEILRERRIIEVEHDDTYVTGCTCNLGDGILSKADHEARGCMGIGLMCRPDFIDEHRHSGEWTYNEFKTTGADNQTFRDKWEVMIQMFAAVLDTERRHGRQIQQIRVHGLLKGKREGDYNYESGKKDGFMRQQSIFCYGYRNPGSPPMEPEEWANQYEWFDEYEQRNRRLGKKYKKTGIWELPNIPEGMSPAEYWCKQLPPEVRRKNLILLGPFSRQEVMVPEFLEEMVAEESHWRDICWQLYEHAAVLLEQHGEDYHYWPDPTYQSLLHRLVFRSYECRRYGQRSKCSFEDICFKREGWHDPLGSGRFIVRRPHHADELNAAIERGLMLPDEGAAEGEEAD